MAELTHRIEKLLQTLENDPLVTPEVMERVRNTIAGSDFLLKQLNEAIEKDELREFSILHGSHAGAEFKGSTNTLHISPVTIGAIASKPFNAEELIFVVGHEIQHSANHVSRMQALAEFQSKATQISRSDSPVHDYTSIIGDLIASNRRDEATAEIAGWNAAISSMKQLNPNLTLQNILEANPHRFQDFIDQIYSLSGKVSYSMKANLSVSNDLMLEPSAKNIEAMGQNFFDKSSKATNIGDLGKSSYATYYAVSAIEFCIAQERANTRRFGPSAEMHIDLRKLGLSEDQLEKEGINLGRDKRPQPYFDGDSLTPRYFDHTQSGSNDHQYVPPPQQKPDTIPQADLLDRFIDALANDDRDALKVLRTEYALSADGQQLAQEAAAHIQVRHDEAKGYVHARGLVMPPEGPSIGSLTGRRDPRDWDHPDHALYTTIRRQLPLDIPDEAAAHLMLQAKRDHILQPSDLSSVGLHNGRAWVTGRLYQAAHVDLSQDPPPMQDTVRQSAALDQQLAQEHAQWLARQQEMARSGPSLSL